MGDVNGVADRRQVVRLAPEPRRTRQRLGSAFRRTECLGLGADESQKHHLVWCPLSLWCVVRRVAGMSGGAVGARVAPAPTVTVTGVVDRIAPSPGTTGFCQTVAGRGRTR